LPNHSIHELRDLYRTLFVGTGAEARAADRYVVGNLKRPLPAGRSDYAFRRSVNWAQTGVPRQKCLVPT